MNYISPIAYASTLNTFRGNYTNLQESEENACPDSSEHEWKKVGKEIVKCTHCGMTKGIAYGYEPEQSFKKGDGNKMKESRMSKSRIKLEHLKQNLSPDEKEQMEEYLDAISEIKKSIKELLLKGSKPVEDELGMNEVGGNMMRKYMK
jgi:ribosomal protein L37AE/L43A